MYRYLVVGRGLIGSAAARHLAAHADGVASVGPDEPRDRAAHDGVFASHYDEGRMTRIVDPAREWSITAKRSIARYKDLERQSGVSFFAPSGYLGLGGPGFDYNDLCASTGQSNGASLERLDAVGIRERFPFLSIRDSADGLVETGTAGHISPRRMVKAQTMLAEKSGATVVRQHATAVRPISCGVEVDLADGTTVKAERALLATGAFTDPCGLSLMDLGLTVFGRTVVRVRVDGDAAETLRSMPTMVVSTNDAYVLPPIQYPDGHLYVKIGIGTDADPRFRRLADLQQWFKSSGSAENRGQFKRALVSLIPILTNCSDWQTDTCAVTQTQSGLPVIDFVHDHVAVAVGGCGKGAKGSDEWGRIAANLLQSSDWDADVPREKLALSI